MSKLNKMTLDCDAQPDLADYAFLIIGTDMPNYAFADDLNRLYGLHLSRTEDMELRDLHWPLFTYTDRTMKLHYYLIECPPGGGSGAWPERHKLLVLRGEMGAKTAEAIHHEFGHAAAPQDKADLLGAERYALLEGYMATLTVTRTVDPQAEPPETLSRKAQKEVAALNVLLAEIVEYIDMWDS